MVFTEEQLKRFAQPISDTEEQMCKNAIKMVKDALSDSNYISAKSETTKLYDDSYSYSYTLRNSLNGRNIKIFVKGSYANNTNIKQNSDVDIAVILESTFRTKYRNDQSDSDYRFTSSSYDVIQFKNEVEGMLREKFGSDVERHNKCILIKGNGYRVDVDSVPCMRLRDYRNNYSQNSEFYLGGIVIKPDNGLEIINYPEQHIEQGVNKNKATNYMYKKMVRVAKHIKNEMDNSGFKYSKEVSSFKLESLLWNIPGDKYNKYSNYKYIFDKLVNYLYNNKSSISNFKEANGIKELFNSDAEKQFYIGFIDELKDFYEYY